MLFSFTIAINNNNTNLKLKPVRTVVTVHVFSFTKTTGELHGPDDGSITPLEACFIGLASLVSMAILS